MPVSLTNGFDPLAFAGTTPAIQQSGPSENLAVRSAVDAISQSGMIPAGRQLSFSVGTRTKACGASDRYVDSGGRVTDSE